MDERLQKQVAGWLEFYRELGIAGFYKARSERPIPKTQSEPVREIGEPATQGVASWHDPGRLEPPNAYLRHDSGPARNAHATPPVAFSPRGPVPQSMSLFESPSTSSTLPEAETLDQICEDLGDCHRCRLASGRKTIVFGQGNPHAELVFVGEGPGADEDKHGLPFVGRAGQLLNRMIQLIGMKREDVYICNVVKCRPPENRTPLPDEIETCSPFLFRQIQAIHPRLVCCLGAPAVRTVLGIKEGITKIRGRYYDYGDMKALPTFHPAYILRNAREEKVLREDFQKISDFLKTPL